jgi:hypothetical protein
MNDITSLENQFFDGLKAVQDPTVEAVRKVAELVGQLPLVDRVSALTSQLPSAEAVISSNFAFAQRLLEVQRDFALELASVGSDSGAPAKPAKKSAA